MIHKPVKLRSSTRMCCLWISSGTWMWRLRTKGWRGRISFFLFFTIYIASVSYAAHGDYRSPEQVEGTITTSLQEARTLFDSGAVFIDVRNPRLYARGHIPGAFHLDLKNAFNEMSVTAIAEKEQAIVIYCSGVKCSRSYHASKKAALWGFRKVHYFRGGIVEWKKAGYPVKTGQK